MFGELKILFFNLCLQLNIKIDKINQCFDVRFVLYSLAQIGLIVLSKLG